MIGITRHSSSEILADDILFPESLSLLSERASGGPPPSTWAYLSTSTLNSSPDSTPPTAGWRA